MAIHSSHINESELRRLAHVKNHVSAPTDALGPQMVDFFKHSVQKRHNKFARIADCWSRLIPELLNDHCALESLHRGTLTVVVDSASHLWELKQLLLAGLQQQLLIACSSAGLRKITLKPGRWYDAADGMDRKVRFS